MITIKITKYLNYFSLCALNLFSWITEINELFHNILIYWDAPVWEALYMDARAVAYYIKAIIRIKPYIKS